MSYPRESDPVQTCGCLVLVGIVVAIVLAVIAGRDLIAFISELSQ